VFYQLLEIAAFYDKNSGGEKPLGSVLAEVSKLEARDVRVSLFEKSKISMEKMKRAVEEIRRIKPQSRGSVVASGGNKLPISGSKKLNLQNTPVLLVSELGDGGDPRPVYVFPCKVGERYYSVLDGISFLKGSLPNLVELPGEMEETLMETLRSNPEKLEPGLVFHSSEQTIPTGKTDLLFTDSSGSFLIVEVERAATDSAVGQILRLAAGFEQNHGQSKLRSAIVCFRINDNVLAAANRAGIEVWKSQDHRFAKLTK